MSELKNSDTPASPTLYMDQTNGSGELYSDNNGLTKREHFAGLAPDSIPNWFYMVFSETSDPKLTWHREGNDLQIGECGLTQEGEIALYFAWRTYYADELLKQLENKGG